MEYKVGSRNPYISMIFQEKKTDTGYNYRVEDIFGEIMIDAPSQLKGEILDEVVVLLLRGQQTAQTITGKVAVPDGTLTYTFVKRPLWEDDEPEVPESPIPAPRPPIWGRIKRATMAAREAWRK